MTLRKLTTTQAFFLKDNQVLLAMKNRDHGAGWWNGPGGKVEAGESIEQAMVRECQEEVGLKPLEYSKLAELAAYQLYAGHPVENTCHVFICKQWEGEPVETEEMIPRWFKTAEIPYEQMWADTTHWLPQVLAGKKLRGEMRYDSGFKLQKWEFQEVTDLP